LCAGMALFFMHKDNKKIVIALSGGVDSAVAAALLKKQGYEVAGVYFHFFSGQKDKKYSQKAKNIAGSMGISFREIDARKKFKKYVTDYFISSYKKGLTPNPCVVCNKEMKFRLMFKLMKEIKADFVATGHYARLGRERKTKNEKRKTKEDYFYKLSEAKDKKKDQSYFLYRLTQKDLSKIIFPLGNLMKDEVRKLAKKFNFPVSGEKESQDVCFIDKGINAFLKNILTLTPGNIADEAGKILGIHQGLPLYTLGQRKGINLGGTGPYFVMRKNHKKNELIVTGDSRRLSVKKFQVEKTNWIGEITKLPLKAKVRIRYHAEKISAIIKSGKSGRLIVETKKSLRAATPGQSAVFYEKKEILGGGIII
jgi:tRNA-uridine 2-sulfurtransferase